MAKSKGRLKGQNAENLAKALAGLQDGTYENTNQAARGRLYRRFMIGYGEEGRVAKLMSEIRN